MHIVNYAVNTHYAHPCFVQHHIFQILANTLGECGKGVLLNSDILNRTQNQLGNYLPDALWCLAGISSAPVVRMFAADIASITTLSV